MGRCQKIEPLVWQTIPSTLFLWKRIKTTHIILGLSFAYSMAFNFRGAGKHVPRAIFVDLEPTVIRMLIFLHPLVIR